MPSPEEILNGLALAANKFYILAIVWHIIVLVAHCSCSFLLWCKKVLEQSKVIN